jgi:hypothetical protein
MKLAPWIAATAVATVATGAHADDSPMFVNVYGAIGVGAPTHRDFAASEPADPEGVLTGRVVLSWEPLPLPYKEPRGYRWGGALVPEVAVGLVHVADRRTGDTTHNSDWFVMAGVRADLQFSQHKGGLLEVSARGSFYGAARVGFLTDPNHTPFLELAAGEAIAIGRDWRVGVEAGLCRYFGEEYQVLQGVAARTPWTDGYGQYLAVNVGAFVGVRL